jgi:hypothetical protein
VRRCSGLHAINPTCNYVSRPTVLVLTGGISLQECQSESNDRNSGGGSAFLIVMLILACLVFGAFACYWAREEGACIPDNHTQELHGAAVASERSV